MLENIPVVGLIASVSAPIATALGAFNLGRFLVTRARSARQKAKTAKATIKFVKAAVAQGKALKAKIDAVTPEQRDKVVAKLKQLLADTTKE